MKFVSDMSKIFSTRTKKIIWNFGLHAFSIMLLFIFVDFILGGLIFYKYVFLAESQAPKLTGSILKFDAKTYQEVMGELQSREQDADGSSAINQINSP